MVGGDGTARERESSFYARGFRPETLGTLLGTQALKRLCHRPLKVSTTPARELSHGLPQHAIARP